MIETKFFVGHQRVAFVGFGIRWIPAKIRQSFWQCPLPFNESAAPTGGERLLLRKQGNQPVAANLSGISRPLNYRPVQPRLQEILYPKLSDCTRFTPKPKVRISHYLYTVSCIAKVGWQFCARLKYDAVWCPAIRRGSILRVGRMKSITL